MDTVIRLNVMIAGLIITFAVYAQVIKIFNRKSAKDISPLMIVALFYNEISFIIYGANIREWPILVLSLISFPGDILLAVGYWKYGRRRKKKEELSDV